jgi:murein DD-endopeptidase MepM/ murein hydrolase activator NlpD
MSTLLVTALVAAILIVIALNFSRFIGTPEILSVVSMKDAGTIDAFLPELTPNSNVVLSYSVKKGDTFSTISNRFGFGLDVGKEVYSSLSKLSKEKSFHYRLRQGMVLKLHLASDGLIKLEIPASKTEDIVINRVATDHYQATLIEHQRIVYERVAVGEVRTSFAQAATEAGISYSIVDELVDLFSDRVEFRKDFRVGDRFTVIFREHVLENGTALSGGDILAAAISVNGELYVTARYVGSDGKSRYFDREGNLLGNMFLRYPLQFSRISSVFSDSRFHPVLKIKKPHNGVDFAAPVGTPVRAVANGKVLFAGWSGPNGIMVKIAHTDRYSTAYLHLSKLAPGIKKGVTLSRGQVIGAVGTTGRSTGPHLHFSFYDKGRYVDPLNIKLPRMDNLGAGTKIDSVYLQRVIYTLEHYHKMDLENSFWYRNQSL